MRQISKGLLLMAFVCMAYSCSRQQPAQDRKEATELGLSLRRAEVDSVWQKMIASDDKRIENTRYFIKIARDISGSDSATAALAMLGQANDSLQVVRYTQENFREKVDQYDLAEGRVLTLLNATYQKYPEYQIANTNMALQEITAADDSILIFRYMYDKASKDFNSIAGKKKSLPLFQLNP